MVCSRTARKENENQLQSLPFAVCRKRHCSDCFLLAGGDKVGSLADVEFTLVWIAGQEYATVVICFSFALIEFSLKRFFGFIIALCPAGVV